MTEKSESLSSEIVREILPPPAVRLTFWRRVLDVVELPVLALITAWRCEPGEDLPTGQALARLWLRQLRAALDEA